MDKVVILARGLGTRMRRDVEAAPALTPGQAMVAAAGVKALMPIGGRPFLDYSLSRLADAGYRRVCLVIGPEHAAVRRYYESVSRRRLGFAFAVQETARGTADAVAAARAFAGDDPFLVVNGDNLYPVAALEALRDLDGCGLAAYDRDALVRESNIEAGRIGRFALVDVDDDGMLRRIVEKPDPATVAAWPRPVRLSMNTWRFDAAIFEAIASIAPSPRGELELPDAVARAVAQLGRRFQVVEGGGGVLDLTAPGDVAAVEARLKHVGVAL